MKISALKGLAAVACMFSVHAAYAQVAVEVKPRTVEDPAIRAARESGKLGVQETSKAGSANAFDQSNVRRRTAAPAATAAATKSQDVTCKVDYSATASKIAGKTKLQYARVLAIFEKAGPRLSSGECQMPTADGQKPEKMEDWNEASLTNLFNALDQVLLQDFANVTHINDAAFEQDLQTRLTPTLGAEQAKNAVYALKNHCHFLRLTSN